MITIRQKGSFKKLDNFLYRKTKIQDLGLLERYGWEGVRALTENTPKDSGITANSWGFQIEKTKYGHRIAWINTNVKDGIPIAILIQYGHMTRNGAYVQGVDYINPAMKDIFKRLADDMWKEVNK